MSNSAPAHRAIVRALWGQYPTTAQNQGFVMTTHNPERRRRLSPARAALVLLALLASLVVTASPAAAATFCLIGDDGDAVVHVDEPTPGATTEIEIRAGMVLVNDVVCGPSGDALTVIDVGEPKVDHVKINLGPGAFRADGESVFVNMFLSEPGPTGTLDKVTVRGTSKVDLVQLQPSFIGVSRPTNYSGADDAFRLRMGFDPEAVRLYFNLRGGDDFLRMLQDDNDNWYDGFVSVGGGSGDDELIGGPRRQRFRGGSGRDELNGFGGDDILKGQGGNDYIGGGSGADQIFGGGGIDTIRAGKGNDIVYADDNVRNDVFGASGNDTCDCDPNDQGAGGFENLI